MAKNPNQRIEWLIDNNRAPKEGEVMTVPELAEYFLDIHYVFSLYLEYLYRTFRLLAKSGKKGFYEGRIGEAIVEAVQTRGGVMTLKDLANHTSELLDPISLDYHDWTVWEIPPNGQGITTLIALGIIEALEEEGVVDFKKLDHNSAEYIHIISEALRIAFADTRHYVTDPQVQHVPTETLLSKVNKTIGQKRIKLINVLYRNISGSELSSLT